MRFKVTAPVKPYLDVKKAAGKRRQLWLISTKIFVQLHYHCLACLTGQSLKAFFYILFSLGLV